MIKEDVLGVVKAVEWIGARQGSIEGCQIDGSYSESYPACVVCGQAKPFDGSDKTGIRAELFGHAKDCPMVALIKNLEGGKS